MKQWTGTGIDIRFEMAAPGITIMNVTGAVDMVAAPVLRHCADEIQPEVRSIVVDLTRVEFFGAAGLSALVHCSKVVWRLGIRWAVACSPVVLRLVRISGLEAEMPVCTNVVEGLARLDREPEIVPLP